MKEVPKLDQNGNIVAGGHSYSQIVAQFLSNPTDIQNNKDLRIMENSLELSLKVMPGHNSP